MLTRFYNEIKNIFKEDYNSTQIMFIYFWTVFLVVNGLWNIIYTVFLFEIGAEEMAIITLINMIAFFVSGCIVVLKKKVTITLYISTFVICLYTIGCTYYFGYETCSFLILIPLFFAIYTLSISKLKNLIVLFVIITLTHILVIMVRVTLMPKYEINYYYIEGINIYLSVASMLFIVYAKTYGVKYIKTHTEKKLTQLKTQANTDFLTSLWNRTYMEQLFSEEKFTKNAFFVLADIDFFKKINDTYGHVAGDYVLKEVAKEMTSFFREDDKIARWGGEEFLIYIKDIPSFEIINKLEKLRESIYNKKIIFDNNEIKVTITFGVKNINEKEHIMKNIDDADKCLYYGKQNGRNQTVYYDDINLEV